MAGSMPLFGAFCVLARVGAILLRGWVVTCQQAFNLGLLLLHLLQLQHLFL